MLSKLLIIIFIYKRVEYKSGVNNNVMNENRESLKNRYYCPSIKKLLT